MDAITEQQTGSVRDAISLIARLAQTSGDLTEMEHLSQACHRSLTTIEPPNLSQSFFALLSTNMSRGHIQLSDGTNTYKIYVRDKFLFQTMLLMSSKYERTLLDNEQNCEQFVTSILRTIQPHKMHTIHLLHLLEITIKKKYQFLSQASLMLIITVMNKAACSPIVGFKRAAQSISRSAVKYLNSDTKQYFTSLINVQIKAISADDLTKLFNHQQLRNNCKEINQFVMKQFHYNVNSRNGSFYYEALIGAYSFDDYKSQVWPLYKPHLTYFEDDDEGEFEQSLIKYWIPINVAKYKSDFYEHLRVQRVSYKLQAHVLLETKKKVDLNQFVGDVGDFVIYPHTSSVGFRIVTFFRTKHEIPTNNETMLVLQFFRHHPCNELSPVIIKCWKQFISQIFLTAHIQPATYKLYAQFLNNFIRFVCLHIDGDYSEMVAQLLLVVLNVAANSSNDLITAYKIDLENVYPKGHNQFYLYLTGAKFWDDIIKGPLIRKINKYVAQFKHCPMLVRLICEKYLNYVDLHDIIDVFVALNFDNFNCVNLQNLETVQTYITLYVKYKRHNSISMDADNNRFLCALSNNLHAHLSVDNLFTFTICLYYFYEQHILTWQDVIIVEEALQRIETILDSDFHANLDNKANKAFEAFINMTIKLALVHVQTHKSINKMLNQFCKIIKLSNMKRPVSLAINALQALGSVLEKRPEGREIKIRLLDDILRDLYDSRKTGKSKIRRNAETRLVIHALVVSNSNNLKPYLEWTLSVLFDITSKSSLPESSTSAALNTLEVLVSDNSIHQATLSYIPDIFEICIRHFDNNSWTIRNADLQLVKALIERFLGVLLDYSHRTKTVEDLFVLFPDTSQQFFQVLSQPQLNRSAIVALLFFSESQLRPNLLADDKLEQVLRGFRFLFAHIIKNYPNNYGFLAVKSFTSLCTTNKIPHVFCDIVDYILSNYRTLKANILANLVNLLGELYYKYACSLERTNLNVINKSMASLTHHLGQFNCFYFNLLSLKVHNTDYVISQCLEMCDCDNFQCRIWLKNYLPLVIDCVQIENVADKLQFMLTLPVPDYLQVKLLEILVDKVINCDNPIITNIMNVLVVKITSLHDCNTFLITAYAKVVLLFNEIAQLQVTPVVIKAVRSNYETNNIYKLLTYCLVLNYADNKTTEDWTFLDRLVDHYVSHIGANEEVLLDLACSVQYLYNVARFNKCKVIKLVYYFLLHNSTSFEMCKFVSSLTKTKCSSVLVSLYKLLQPTNLIKCLGDDKSVVRLLLDVYCYACELPEMFQDSDTFYLIESDLSVPKAQVKKIVRKCMILA